MHPRRALAAGGHVRVARVGACGRNRHQLNVLSMTVCAGTPRHETEPEPR
ncbi:hypothetical protein NSERUTF1_2880 [Nocardia seriolae]|nr:hypothetical protein NSERUTF1_2880 [Nocardia seriolae]